MRSILDLFAKSPFGPIQGHMSKVNECVEQVSRIFSALLDGDQGEVMKVAKELSRLEHEADEIKNSIRSQLPKSIFLPVDRGDLLTVLGNQDAIADVCEDLGILLTMRELNVPDSLREPFMNVVDKAVSVAREAESAMKELDGLVKSAFGGPEAGRVSGMIDNLGVLEHECDKAQWEFARKVFDNEGDLTAGELWMFLKLGETLGQLANNAENVGKRLQLMLKI